MLLLRMHAVMNSYARDYVHDAPGPGHHRAYPKLVQVLKCVCVIHSSLPGKPIAATAFPDRTTGFHPFPSSLPVTCTVAAPEARPSSKESCSFAKESWPFANLPSALTLIFAYACSLGAIPDPEIAETSGR